MLSILDDFQNQTKQAIIHFQEELKSLHTGRASAGIVENIIIEAYGGRSPLKSLAQIIVPEARSIVVEPYDKNIIKDVERGIVMAKLDLNPSIQGSLIRIKLPELTEQSRQNLVKILRGLLEKSRIQIRKARDEAKKFLEQQKTGGEITEDDYYELIEKLDLTISQANQTLENLTEAKEQEIMRI